MKMYAIQTALKYHTVVSFVKLIAVANKTIQQRLVALPLGQLVPESESVRSKTR
jgi:hypothetical protein